MVDFRAPSYAEIRQLDEKLEELKLRRHPVDGNSFFHAVVRQLELKYPEKQSNVDLRAECVEYLEKTNSISASDGESWRSFVQNHESPEEYLSRMRDEKERADHIMIQAAASFLKSTIIIINAVEGNVSINPKILDTNEQITLGHIPEYHYFSAEWSDKGNAQEIEGTVVKSLWDASKHRLGPPSIKSKLKTQGREFAAKKTRFEVDDESPEERKKSTENSAEHARGQHPHFSGLEDWPANESESNKWTKATEADNRTVDMDEVLNSALGDQIGANRKRSRKVTPPYKKFISVPPEDLSDEDGKTLAFFTKFAKYLTVLVFGGIVFLGALCTKATLLVLTNAYSQDYTDDGSCPMVNGQPYYIRYHTMLMLMVCLCFPEVLTFVYSAYRLIMKSEESLDWRECIMGMIPEILHAVGSTFLVVKVLPDIDATLGTLMFYFIALIPAMIQVDAKFQSFLHHRQAKDGAKREQNERKKSLIYNMISLILQLSGYILLSWQLYTQIPHNDNVQDFSVMIYAVVSLLFVSFRYWENFVTRDYFIDSKTTSETKEDGTVFTKTVETSGMPLLSIQKKLDGVRFKTAIIYSVVRMCFIVVVCFFIHFVINGNQSVVQEVRGSKRYFREVDNPGRCKRITGPLWYGVLVHCICSMLSFFFGRIACQTCVHVQAYSFPLLLVTPAMSTLTSVYTMYGAAKGITLMDFFKLPVKYAQVNPYIGWKTTFSGSIYYWQMAFIVVGGLLVGILSLVFLTLYVWSLTPAKMERTEVLFVKPIYGGPLIAEDLMLNLRQYLGMYKERLSNVMKDKKNWANRHKPRSSGKKSRRNTHHIKAKFIPQVFLCATMWHETEQEMTQLLTSIMRLDKHQSGMPIKSDDYFNFQVHVLFDDAMEWIKKKVDEDSNEYEEVLVPNKFVKLLVRLISVASMKVNQRPHGQKEDQEEDQKEDQNKNAGSLKPFIYPTPYGGRLEFVLPCGNMLHVHLKDNDKIRNRKRWSQCMYMYYILGYLQETKKEYKKESVFLLALDGDVDFQPKSLIYLLDRMKRNPDVGAACGRIHPIGSGPVVWFQKFEYAVGHWLQKSAEHVIGCVLCSPGCFSLFRGKALMDTNVVHTYTTRATEATHYIQWDQGEDRWLCTLLLKQGWRIEYAANSDSYTYAPEEFKEFFNQRRRWGPSTMANVFDILMDSKRTIRNNDYISRFYIAYQTALMASTILGPATVVLVVQGAFAYVFGMSPLGSLLVALIPVIIFVILCYTTSQDFQVAVAGILTIVYALVMMAVLVGIIGQMTETLLNPNSIFMLAMIFIYAFTGIIHPTEMMCLLHGLLYYLCVPSAFILLMVYSLCNMNNVSWGTREVKKAVVEEAEATEQALKDVANRKKPKSKMAKNLQLGPSVYDTPSTSDGYYSCGLGNLCQCALCINPVPDVPQQPQIVNKNRKVTVVDVAPDQYKDPKRQPITGLNKEDIRRYSVAKSKFMGEQDGDPDALERKLKNRISVSELRYWNNKNLNVDNAAMLRKAMKKRRESKRKMSMHDKANKLAMERQEGQQETPRRKITGLDSDDDVDDDLNEIIDEERSKDEEKEGLDWIVDGPIEDGVIAFIGKDEHLFWKDVINEFLTPLPDDKVQKKKIQSDLITLRNKMTGAYFLINSLWIVLTFSLTLAIQDINITFNDKNGNEIVLQPLAFLFLIFFLVILIIQFVTMLIHRWSTFIHLMAATTLVPTLDENNINKNENKKGTYKKGNNANKRNKKRKKIKDIDNSVVEERENGGVDNRAFSNDIILKSTSKTPVPGSLRMKNDNISMSFSPATDAFPSQSNTTFAVGNMTNTNESQRKSSFPPASSLDKARVVTHAEVSFGGNFEMGSSNTTRQEKRSTGSSIDLLNPVNEYGDNFENQSMNDKLDAAMLDLTSQKKYDSDPDDSDVSYERTVL